MTESTERVKTKLSDNPISISKTVWYYEEEGALLFVVECRDKERGYHRTMMFRAPIAKLRKSLAKYAAPKPKERT